MSNSTNGARGGSSRRSDRKNNSESTSVNGHDDKRRTTEEPQKPVDVLAQSSGAIQRLADLAHFFLTSFTPDLQVVEGVLGPEIEKEKTIRTLRETVASLTHIKSEETISLQNENKQLLADREACQQEKKKYLKMQQKLEDQHALTEASRQKEIEHKLLDEKAKAERALTKKKAELEDDHQKKVQESDKKILGLSAANVELKQRCLDAEEKLKTKKIRHARAQKSLEDENENLKEERKQLQAQFPVEGQPIEY